ncbi:MAG: sigma-70 family RNA polymerase sigma factor [Actinomycetota bacterium]
MGGISDDTFEDFFRVTLPDALRVARRILCDPSDAEDAAAEAFARAHASWSRITALPHRRAWVLRVTANVAVDMTRRRRPLPFVRDAVDDEAERAVLTVALAAALRSLPRRQREIVVLRYLDGYSEAETAAALGVSAGTVKKTAHRAMGALRRRLGDGWDRFEAQGASDATY